MHNWDCPEPAGVIGEVQREGSLNSTNAEKVRSGQGPVHALPPAPLYNQGDGAI